MGAKLQIVLKKQNIFLFLLSLPRIKPQKPYEKPIYNPPHAFKRIINSIIGAK